MASAVETSASETSDSNACNSACPDLSDDQKEDEDFQWEEDQFDRTFGIEDFGYGSTATDVADDLPPSQALAAIEAANIPDYPLPLETEYQMPDLDHLGEDQRQELLRLLCSYSTLFDGGEDAVSHIPGIQHRIDTGQATPVCTRQWHLPQATRQTIRKQCDAMPKNGVIESSTSPWLSPVVLVQKKDGSLRFCVDYRNLNAVTTADTFPLPRIDELIDELSPSDTFTTLDAKAAYWSVEVHPEDRPKTAFSDGYRLFQFWRLPFGLSTAPTTFQRTMNFVLSSVLGHHTLAYLDDVVVYSRGFSQHLKDLEETLQLLAAAGLKLNIEKCKFAATTINFLGFTSSR